jgi:hypothetical protein
MARPIRIQFFGAHCFPRHGGTLEPPSPFTQAKSARRRPVVNWFKEVHGQARPHPGPSPPRRGRIIGRLTEKTRRCKCRAPTPQPETAVGCSLSLRERVRVRVREQEREDHRTTHRKNSPLQMPDTNPATRDCRRLFPLPPGEGQGEGSSARGAKNSLTN